MRHFPARPSPSLAAAALLLVTAACQAQGAMPWPIHSMDRPQPPVVTPAPGAGIAAPPGDAVVLFDGHDLSAWRSDSGAPPRWSVRDGYFEVRPGTGALSTVRAFGDCQLHVEWAAPTPPHGEGQERGNSGVFLMGRYEVQVLDSYRNRTYPDGQAAAIYGQYPPLVNASRPPGDWQAYDIIFHRPRFDARGGLVSPARMTVFHNGILVQDDVTLTGPTAHKRRPPYVAHPDRLPLSLQDHGDPVRFRNVWVRELE